MDRDLALQSLTDDSWHHRLKAARALATLAYPEDLQLLQSAQTVESNSYVKKILDSIIRRVRRDIEEAQLPDAEIISPSVLRQVHANAVEEVTRTILHEIESIAGSIELAADRDIPNYSASTTKIQVDRLQKQLEGIVRLKAAASAPKIEQFQLGFWINEIVEAEPRNERLWILLVGPENLPVKGDPKLLRLAVCNGLKNAIEAVQGQQHLPDNGSPHIVVSWDCNEVECWVAIKDEGPGLGAIGLAAMDLGRTTKPGHSGMGLTTARQAMESHGGSIALHPGAQGGALFEVRWFGQ